MKNKKLTIGVTALTMMIGATGFAASSFAYQGDPSVQGPNYTPERHEAMEEAFDTNNYTAWNDLMSGNGRATQVVNETNFAQFAEARELAKSGDLEGAEEIRAELGLGQGSKGQRMGNGNKQGRGEGKGKGMNGSGNRGQNAGGNFVDVDGDGTCDNVQ